jgi:hypothetical protein
MGPVVYPETSARNYHYSPRNNPEERSSHFLRGGSLKSRTECTKIGYLNCLPCGARTQHKDGLGKKLLSSENKT